MEPPAKRRRQGRSPLDGPAEDDDDDDELSFEPHEILAKRDPGYKLSLERAYADSRFQATMAHIFEKYGRDFDGIGDEIDMMTGEIVVDNGHLQNMRNEGDVGIPGIRNGQADDDDGILLRDVTDDEARRVLRPEEQGDGAGADAGTDDEEDEEDRIMHGRAAHHRSNSLVPASRPQVSPKSSMAPISLSGPYGGRHQASGPTPTFGASPLAFAASPFSMDPWAFPNHLSVSYRGPPDILPRPSRLLPSARERYDFPVRNGGCSIWSLNYRYKENEPDRLSPLSLGPVRPSPKTRIRPMKYILPSVLPDASEEEQVDEDAILTGKSSGNDQVAVVKEASAPEHDEDNLLSSGIALLREQTRKHLKQAEQQAAAEATSPQTNSRRDKRGTPGASVLTKKQQARCASDPPPEENQPYVDKDVECLNGAQDGFSKRRSGRARKQVDYLNKISWIQAREQRRTQQCIMVQLTPMDRSTRDEYEMVDEVADSADEALCSSGPSEQTDDRAAEPLRMEQVVPDSQDTATSHGSRGHGGNASDNKTRQLGWPNGAVDAAYMLSDDEMPIPWKPPKGAKHQKKPAQPTTLQSPPDSGIGDSTATLDPTDDTKPQHAAADVTPSDLQAATKRRDRRGRPRRSTAAASHNQPEEGPAAQEPGAGRPSTASMEERSQRLTRELRWLKKLGGLGLAMPQRSSGEVQAATPGPAASGHRRRSARHAWPAQPQEQQRDDEAPRDDTPTPSKDATEAAAVRDDTADRPPSSPEESPAPRKHPPTPPSKPQTPRRTSPPTSRAPSSRRSLLSLLSAATTADDDDDESDLDELGHSLAGARPAPLFGAGATRKIWKSSARTTEVLHTPVKRRPTDVVSPASVIRTPGGTVRTCGIDGYRCGRDFCFTCL